MALPRRTNQPGADTPAADGTPAPGGAPAGGADWRAHYAIEDQDAVEAYLARHPTLQPILAEAPDEIRAVFGTDEPPRLRMVSDPDEGDTWLFVGIPSSDAGPHMLALIDAFEQRWWLDQMLMTDAVVVFDVVTR